MGNLIKEIEYNIQKYPNKIAMIWNEKKYSYQDLRTAIDKVSSFFISNGCKLNDLIAVYSHPTPEALITMIAINKAGGAFLPIDPLLPVSRIQYYIEESQPKWVICFDNNEICRNFYSHLFLSYYSICNFQHKIVFNNSGDDQIAYILYTSGSTGHPKGIEVSMKGFAYFIRAISNRLSTTSSISMLSIASLSFDISLLELFLPLVNGGKIVFTPPKTSSNPEELVQFLNAGIVNVVQATPSIWELTRMWGWQGNQKLTLLTAGEPLNESLARYLLQSCCSLWNGYGPTETIVYASAKQILPDFKQVTIGAPLHGYYFSIKDENGRELPVGEKGELYISGKCLANGYHNKLDLTASKFINLEGVSYYKTGDLAIQLADGDYVILGRIDRQVKIRGYRVELSEIEHAFSKMPEVHQCIVHCINNPIENAQELIAFWIAADKRIESSWENRKQELIKSFRNQLSSTLPHYMIPTKFVCLKSFPLLTNGKVDLHTLAKIRN